MEISDVDAILGLSWLRVWNGADNAARRACGRRGAGRADGPVPGLLPDPQGHAEVVGRRDLAAARSGRASPNGWCRSARHHGVQADRPKARAKPGAPEPGARRLRHGRHLGLGPEDRPHLCRRELRPHLHGRPRLGRPGRAPGRVHQELPPGRPAGVSGRNSTACSPARTSSRTNTASCSLTARCAGCWRAGGWCATRRNADAASRAPRSTSPSGRRPRRVGSPSSTWAIAFATSTDPADMAFTAAEIMGRTLDAEPGRLRHGQPRRRRRSRSNGTGPRRASPALPETHSFRRLRLFCRRPEARLHRGDRRHGDRRPDRRQDRPRSTRSACGRVINLPVFEHGRFVALFYLHDDEAAVMVAGADRLRAQRRGPDPRRHRASAARNTGCAT